MFNLSKKSDHFNDSVEKIKNHLLSFDLGLNYMLTFLATLGPLLKGKLFNAKCIYMKIPARYIELTRVDAFKSNSKNFCMECGN
jgi:hypothetical protein